MRDSETNLESANTVAANYSTALEALGELPVDAVKGVGREWTAVLATTSVRTVAELAAMNDEDVARLLASAGTRHPIEIRTLARLLDAPLPSVDRPLVDLTLYSAAGIPAATLAEDLDIDSATARQLAELLARAYTAMNSRWLQRLPLGTFFASA